MMSIGISILLCLTLSACSKKKKAPKIDPNVTAKTLFLEARSLMDGNYKFDEPDTALDTIDRYMRVYPRAPRMDYALYLRGLINFTRGGSIIDKVFPRNFSDLDGVRQKEAFNDFSALINRHKGSPYAVDAKKRMHYLKNTLGDSEVSVAKYYMKRGAYLAAFNRADYAIKYHQGTPAVIPALQIKTCAARKLGKSDLASDTMRIIKLNFPSKTKFSCL